MKGIVKPFLVPTAILISIVAVAFVFIQVRAQNMEKYTAAKNSEASGTGQRTLLRDARIVIRKKDRVLELFDGDVLINSFSVVLGSAPDGDKKTEGDGRTPEGEFYLFTKNRESKFHLSLGISYPSKEDAERGLVEGLISRAERDEIIQAIEQKRMPPQKTALGGEIYIHGGGVEQDWTWGCIALRNVDIEELFSSVPVGARVIIRP